MRQSLAPRLIFALLAAWAVFLIARAAPYYLPDLGFLRALLLRFMKEKAPASGAVYALHHHLEMLLKTGLLHLVLAGFGAGPIGAADAAAIREIGRLFVGRAGRIAAAVLAAALTRIDPGLERSHTAAVDGSLFEKMPGFRTSMEEAFIELYGDRAGRIAPALTHDGSGLGAAIIAASATALPGGPA